MAEQKESSVLFSLKELMNLEEDRIKQEEQEKRRQEDAATHARMEAERRAREEEEARLRAEQDRRHADEQRVREDAARLEAIHKAELEKARLDAENAARLEQLRHVQEHERNITAIKQDKHKKSLQIFAYGAAALFVIALVGATLFIKHQMDESTAENARHAQELAEQQAQVKTLMNQLSSQTDNISRSGQNHNKRNAELIGGGAGIGALIGGAAGAGAGTGTAAYTGKKEVRIPAETRLSFRLTRPLTITVKD